MTRLRIKPNPGLPTLHWESTSKTEYGMFFNFTNRESQLKNNGIKT